MAAIAPSRIYLFGSKARGEAGADSDYDLLLLVENPTEPSYRLAQRAYAARKGILVSVDIVVWDRRTFESRLPSRPRFQQESGVSGGGRGQISHY